MSMTKKMKQILIRYTDDIPDVDAINYALVAFKGDDIRKGVVIFSDKAKLEYSSTSRHPAVTIWRDGTEL